MRGGKEKMTLKGKRIGVFGKGGAGKSTVTVLLAQALRMRGYSVCVLDADSTNLGLFQIFEVHRSPRPLMDYFGGMVFSGGSVTCPVDDPLPLAAAEIELETLSPEYYARNPEGIILFIAGKIGDQKARSKKNGDNNQVINIGSNAGGKIQIYSKAVFGKKIVLILPNEKSEKNDDKNPKGDLDLFHSHSPKVRG